MRSPFATTREWPLLTATREKPAQQQRPSTVENKLKRKRNHLQPFAYFLSSLLAYKPQAWDNMYCSLLFPQLSQDGAQHLRKTGTNCTVLLLSFNISVPQINQETLLPCKNNYHHTEQVFPQICFEKRWSTGYSHPEMALVWSHATPGPRFPVFCSCCSLSVPHPLSDLFVFILQDFTLPRPSPNQTESICPRVLHRPLDYQLLKDKGTSYSSCPQVLAQCLQCATQLRNAW